uniref:(California timema) hypothetical protein n=1 Tax=Timema californicum TaxID=61474 RepID=A0A7R9P677_TIMCA|nr:unnamed protein product [Timema californicum]
MCHNNPRAQAIIELAFERCFLGSVRKSPRYLASRKIAFRPFLPDAPGRRDGEEKASSEAECSDSDGEESLLIEDIDEFPEHEEKEPVIQCSNAFAGNEKFGEITTTVANSVRLKIDSGQNGPRLQTIMTKPNSCKLKPDPKKTRVGIDIGDRIITENLGLEIKEISLEIDEGKPQTDRSDESDSKEDSRSQKGSYGAIRNAMKKRGWLEKREPRWTPKRSNHNGNRQTKNTSPDPTVISRLLRNIQVDFLWTMRADACEWMDFKRKQLVNRFPRTGFNTKIGLCASLQQMHWFNEAGVSQTLFPRSYNICNTDEWLAFQDDFRMTACLSLLRWMVIMYEEGNAKAIQSLKGKVPVAAVDFAVKRCNEYISVQNHEDIDKENFVQVWDYQWDQFITWYYLIVHANELLVETKDPSAQMLYNLALLTLGKMKKYWPQMHLDGLLNIWIVKPGASSRGRGIVLMDRMEKIMAKVNPSKAKETRYVVQKYMGRVQGKADMWDKRIYPGMRQSIIGALLAAQETMDRRKNCFELFGADFMLDEHLTPWLIEINSCPAMCESTSVTARMCSQCLEDVIKEETSRLFGAKTNKLGTGSGQLAVSERVVRLANKLGTGSGQLRVRGLIDWPTSLEQGLTGQQSWNRVWPVESERVDRLANKLGTRSDQLRNERVDRLANKLGTGSVVIDRRQNKKAETGMFEMVFRQRIPPAPAYLGMTLAVRGEKIYKTSIVKPGNGMFRTNFIKQLREEDLEQIRIEPTPCKATAEFPSKSPLPDIAETKPIKRISTEDKGKYAEPNIFLDEDTVPVEIVKPIIQGLIENLKYKDDPNHFVDTYEDSPADTVQASLLNLFDGIKYNKDNVFENIFHTRDYGRDGKESLFEIEASIVTSSSDSDSDNQNPNKEINCLKEGEIVESNATITPDLLDHEFESNTKTLEAITKEGGTQNFDTELNSATILTKDTQPTMQKETTPKRKKLKSNTWRNSDDAVRAIEFYDEWKKKLAHTRASCEELLYKLRVFKETDGLVTKPKCCLDKNVIWDGDMCNKPTLSDVIKKLSQTQSGIEVCPSSSAKSLMESLSDSQTKNKMWERRTSYLNMAEEDIQTRSKHTNEKLCSNWAGLDYKSFCFMYIRADTLISILEAVTLPVVGPYRLDHRVISDTCTRGQPPYPGYRVRVCRGSREVSVEPTV